MKKDLQSYDQHNKEYNATFNSFEYNKAVVEEYDKKDYFKNLGFKLAIEITKSLPATHIDIGSGTGWLLRKTSPYFEKVVGVEPSDQAIKIAKQIVSEYPNVEFINLDMTDAIDQTNLIKPVFITTATVLNHIENTYVSHFLHKIDHLPIGSVLFFDERYGTNMNWRLWHVRSKDWWREQLPSWQLIFFDIDAGGYQSGIYGIRMSEDELLPYKRSPLAEQLIWYFSLPVNIIIRVFKKLLS